MDAMPMYHPPLALTIVSGIFLALGAVCAIGIAVDIIIRKGWQSMMGIMIPVYIINATYLGPFAVYIYYRFGRPAKPLPSSEAPLFVSSTSSSSKDLEKQVSSDGSSANGIASEEPNPGHCCSSKKTESAEPIVESIKACHKGDSSTDGYDTKDEGKSCHKEEKKSCHASGPSEGEGHACHSTRRPFWATVTSGVFHCGAGCVLGDIVGEWLVYGTGATINGRMIWPELLIDYAFALVFGIVFQYFSIAPMTGQWGPMTFWRAAKADVASLTSFEIGAFAWMIAFQVGIFGDKLDMDAWAYWFLMQIGMCLGVVTAWPANYWLLTHHVKEACC